jgi:hypothetical protein
MKNDNNARGLNVWIHRPGADRASHGPSRADPKCSKSGRPRAAPISRAR